MTPLVPIQNYAKKYVDAMHTAFNPLSKVWSFQTSELSWTPKQSSAGWEGETEGLSRPTATFHVHNSLTASEGTGRGGETRV